MVIVYIINLFLKKIKFVFLLSKNFKLHNLMNAIYNFIFFNCLISSIAPHFSLCGDLFSPSGAEEASFGQWRWPPIDVLITGTPECPNATMPERRECQNLGIP